MTDGNFGFVVKLGRHSGILKRGVTKLDQLKAESGNRAHLTGDCVRVLACLLLAVRSTWAAPLLFAEVKDGKEFAGEGKKHPSNMASPLVGQQYFPDCH